MQARSPRRRWSGDQPSRSYDSSNGSSSMSPNNIGLSQENSFSFSDSNFSISEQVVDYSYGGEEIGHVDPGSARYIPGSFSHSREAPRTPLSQSGDGVSEITANIPDFIEGIENDSRKPEEVEEAGLSQLVTLPANSDQPLSYTHNIEQNSAWKAEKYEDKKIGKTSLQSIYSVKLSISELGGGKATLFCPQGPIKDDEDVSLVQARWL